MKIRPLGADFFHEDGQMEEQTDGWTNRRTDGRTDGRMDEQTGGRTDGQTDVTKLIVAFHNFANAPKKTIMAVFFT
jgi:hypothetical protein